MEVANSRQLAGRPSVILVVVDTARADAFVAAPVGESPTPAFAQMASEGWSHDAAYAPSSWTVPSHVSFLSGRPPRATGLHLANQDGEFFKRVIKGQQENWLPSVLRDAGYRTVGISTNGWVSEGTGFATGFDEFIQVPSRRAPVDKKSPWSFIRRARQALQAERDDGAREVMGLIAERLGGHDPLFLFVNLVECHSPYMPPLPFTPLGIVGRLLASVDSHRYCTFDSIWKVAFGQKKVPLKSLARMRAQYFGSARQVDRWLDGLRRLLAESGRAESTQLIVTSDHGENLGEAGRFGHAFSLDDRLIRVPFVTAGPATPERPEVLRLVDLPGLIGAAVGLDDHPWRPPASGPVAVSEFVAPVWAGDPLSRQAAQDLPAAAKEMVYRSFTCATDGRFKLLRDGAGERLIDLQQNPYEEDASAEDVSGRECERLAPLRVALDEADEQALRSLPVECDPLPEPPDAGRMEQMEKQMRLLGYM